jgi:hypothetical protein
MRVYQQLVGGIPDTGTVRQFDLISPWILVIGDKDLGRLIASRAVAELELENVPFDIEGKLD